MKSFKNQAEVEREIDRCIAIALRHEERRDRQPFESAAYWAAHDKAIAWHMRAAKLMPRGSM